MNMLYDWPLQTVVFIPKCDFLIAKLKKIRAVTQDTECSTALA